MVADFGPKLLLFLSVDIIGSTAFKNSIVKSEQIHPWLPLVNGFYNEFPIYFFRNLYQTSKKYTNKVEYELPRVWKCLGDELVFVVKLTSSCQPIFYVSSFRKAIVEYNASMFQIQQPQLGLKASAWLGGFPVSNAEVVIKQNNSNSEEIDYIGPSIDIGFRLSRLADSRRMVISVELAYMISVSANTTEDKLPIYFNGREHLKGVLNNREYPVFWVHMSDDKEDLELKMLNITACDKESVSDYCRRFIKESNGMLEIPFISGDNIFNVKPNDYESKFNRAREAFEERCAQYAPTSDEEKTDTISGEKASVVANSIIESVKKS